MNKSLYLSSGSLSEDGSKRKRNETPGQFHSKPVSPRPFQPWTDLSGGICSQATRVTVESFLKGRLICCWAQPKLQFLLCFLQEQRGQASRAQLFVKFLEAIVEVYGVPMTEQKTHRSGSVASIKPLAHSSSTEDVRAASASSSLSSSLTSLAGAAAGKNLFIPLPFKRASSSYRPKKSEKESSPKFRRNWSARGTRSTSAGKIVKP